MPQAEPSPHSGLTESGFTLPGSGFTLIEMIAVLAILALTATLVLARGPQHSAALDMRIATTTIAQNFRLARTRAIAANRPVAVTFDVRSATIRIAGARTQALPAHIAIAVTASEGQGSSILFLPDGSSTGGRIDLAGPAITASVGVDWLTGRVSVSAARNPDDT